MLLANMNGNTSARLADRKAPAPARLLSEGRLDGTGSNSLESLSVSGLQSTAIEASSRTKDLESFQRTSSTENTPQGRCGRGQNRPELQKQSSDARAKVHEVERRGNAKPNYRGVRQRPWGEFLTALILQASNALEL